jgi:hypothetical protein
MRTPKAITYGPSTAPYVVWARKFGVSPAAFYKAVQRHGEQGAIDLYISRIDTSAPDYPRRVLAFAILSDLERRASTNPSLQAYLLRMESSLA